MAADSGAVSCDAHAVIGGFGWGPRSAEVADGWRGFLHHLGEFAPLGPLVLFLRRLSTGGVGFVRLETRLLFVLYIHIIIIVLMRIC